jgi:hypothetical protein
MFGLEKPSMGLLDAQKGKGNMKWMLDNLLSSDQINCMSDHPHGN